MDISIKPRRRKKREKRKERKEERRKKDQRKKKNLVGEREKGKQGKQRKRENYYSGIINKDFQKFIKEYNLISKTMDSEKKLECV